MPKLYVIVSFIEADEESGEPLYWSNLDGWVDRREATTFSAQEKDTLRLPIDGNWRKA